MSRVSSEELIPVAKPMIGSRERDAVDRVLFSGALTQGQQVSLFEEEFSYKVAHGSHCISVNSGTSALHLTMLGLEIGPGDEVIVPSFSFAATANAVALTGAIPVFADIDEESFCLDPESVALRVTSRTRAIIPVHLYGHPAHMTALQDVCSKFGLALIEDAAQAHAATWNGQFVGTFGTAGCFSFYPTKNMTCGEGGMVVTRDETLARRIRLLRNQGQERRYFNEIVGFNNRMSDVHAAIGRVQLQRLFDFTAQRVFNATYLRENLRGVVVPHVSPEAEHVYHQYTIRVPHLDREHFAYALESRGIGTGIYYPTPIHRLPSYNMELDLPKTEVASSEVISLPIHPGLCKSDLEKIVDSVNELTSSGI